jgi:cytochrome c biogenesis protein CcmG/thiol:disulfide interchange protein DsbE
VEQPLSRGETKPEPGGRSAGSLGLKLVGVTVIAGLLGLLVWATLAAGNGQGFVAKIAAGKKPQAPAFTLGVLWPASQTWPPDTVPALADGKLRLTELRGRPVVLNFWASWCLPCRDEAPILHASALRHRGEVVFVGIDVRDLSSDARSFLRRYKVNYVSVRDRGDGTWTDYGLTGVPETYYIDAQGRAVAHTPGAVSERTLEQGIAAITG